jgi:hypothetical protein
VKVGDASGELLDFVKFGGLVDDVMYGVEAEDIADLRIICECHGTERTGEDFLYEFDL